MCWESAQGIDLNYFCMLFTDCSISPEKFRSHAGIGCTGRQSGEGARGNSKGSIGYAGIHFVLNIDMGLLMMIDVRKISVIPIFLHDGTDPCVKGLRYPFVCFLFP